MYQTIILVFIFVDHSFAVLTSIASGKFSSDRRVVTPYTSNLNNRSHIKREGVYSYHPRPHFVSYPSHPDTSHLYEVNHEYEDHGFHEHPTHLHHHDNHDKDLAIKALFAPLFGIALLGVVAAMVNSPVLLQLGALSGRRRRRRRDITTNDDPSAVAVPSALINKLHNDLMMIGHILSQMPRSNLRNEERKLVESYFTCSELGKSLKSNESCFKRLACELWSDKSNMNMVTSQRVFIKTILTELLNNEFMQNDIRRNIKDAQRFGIESGHCEIYACGVINTM